YAVEGFTGKRLWSAPISKKCSTCSGYSAAATAIPGVVFAGTRDGLFRAFNSKSGRLIWEFNIARKFSTTEGDVATGSAMDGPGPVIVDGFVYVNSGYAAHGGGAPGNVLLAFSVDGK